ncbi:hypothetical protein [Oceanococcus atlanticus]|uniref:hypothetical protein n=1 Tax=Oceanococcus atlanticus TaxID=1317117 RepID=UPI001F0A77C0|nr:hypothetical protein [Oceanococcus atlanticus]
MIDAHTIQRKGPLAKIADETGHVMCFDTSSSPGRAEISSRGWRKASTFPGYCQKHDSSLFEPLEKLRFTGTHEQCVLQAFRNICNELYRKRALVESLEFQRDMLDRGRSLDQQISIQMSIFKNLEGQRKSIEENDDVRQQFEDAISTGNYEKFSSRCYFFTGELEVVSSAILQCEFDFCGTQLTDLWDLDLDADLLSHSVMETESGGAIVFVWPSDAKNATRSVQSFDQIPTESKGDIFVQYCFLQSENTYFSKAWWNRLPPTNKDLIRRLANSLYYDGGAFKACDTKLVNWTMASVDTI